MRRILRVSFAAFSILALSCISASTPPTESKGADIEQVFIKPPQEAKPWVFWYWLNAAVSKEGIAADLRAMKDTGIGGAYLVPIRGASTPPVYQPVVEQLTPIWWEHVLFALREADKLGISIAMHASDGFATAGGPWVKPEMSMQKVVWTKTRLTGGKHVVASLAQPETNSDYYRDIALFAYRASSRPDQNPKIRSSQGNDVVQFLASDSTKTFKSEKPCWLLFEYQEPFTCRAITIRTPHTKAIQSNTYRANCFSVEASDDGSNFRQIARCEAPRHGWQDGDADVTHAIPATTARYFRLNFDPTKAEPAAEDLDSTKWKASLTLQRVTLSGEPTLHQFEGKSGHVWRVSPRTPQLDGAVTPAAEFIDLSTKISKDGALTWDAPEGEWTLLRLGCTTTGFQNDSAGPGKGLECDKLNPEAARDLFEHWFAEIIRNAGPELAGKVLKVFHVDSWECGSQNWTPMLLAEFQKRRGYDPRPFLPSIAGIPVESVDASEAFLRDYRETISELTTENFFGTLRKQANEHGCQFSAESVAPVMTGDGVEPFREVDIPMGEFWLRSPTHDKPNDVLDGIAGAHLYGRQIAQMEAFTELRMMWDETPTLLKPVGDRNYALGANRFLIHVFTQNPWTDHKPGMTLGGCGLYFQRDQTWWKPGRAWVEYQQRCNALLQSGRPVNDIAIYMGDEIPRRALLPWNLAATFPDEFPANDSRRAGKFLEGCDWVDPLNGISYDSLNRDALLHLATVIDGRIILPGGAKYAAIVIPARNPLMPEANVLRADTLRKLTELARAGATIVFSETPVEAGVPMQHSNKVPADRDLSTLLESKRQIVPIGKGRLYCGVLDRVALQQLGLSRDVVTHTQDGNHLKGLAWTHRAGESWDLYFIGNQKDEVIDFIARLRTNGRVPELWNPVTGERREAKRWNSKNGRTDVPLRLEARESVFVVFRQPSNATETNKGANFISMQTAVELKGPWSLHFDPSFSGPSSPIKMNDLRSWTESPDDGIRHYSGTVEYRQKLVFSSAPEGSKRYWLELGEVHDLAEVTINGVSCGIAWTPPYRVEITQALKQGENTISILVTNTWFNRLAGDRSKPEKERLTKTTAPERTEGRPLMKAGLLGPILITNSSRD